MKLIQPFVVRRTQHGTKCLAELARVRRSLMRSECGIIFPDSQNGEVICAWRVLLINVITYVSVIRTASGCLSRQKDFGFFPSWRRDIDMCDNV